MFPNLNDIFIEKYGKTPQAVYFAPGRVNLIGEHIDYNGGLVMPCAITAGTWLLLAPNNDQVIRFNSLNFPEALTIPLADSYKKENNIWYNYPLGIFDALQQMGIRMGGLDLLYFGNIPIGAGLSSSASIEVLTAFALNDFFALEQDKLELVQLAKRVENEFIGVNCGIMDQFAIAFAEKDKAVVLHCDSLKYKLIDCLLGDYLLAIIDTHKVRQLADSKYNERVKECQQALRALQQEIHIDHLCALSAEKFALHSHLIQDETILKRASHVVKENDRVQLAAKALSAGDLQELGRLMYASHHSLRSLYEVTGKELDTIVDFCSGYEHVIGARMTGAGFGGCAIALLKRGHEEDFSRQLNQYYQDKIGHHATIYLYEIGDGVKKL